MVPSSVSKPHYYQGGGTNFDPPFDMAANLAQKYISNSIILFIFMTDGGSSYPVSGVQKLRSLQANNPNRFKYAGI